MPMQAVCDACKAVGVILLRPCGDRVMLPEGWAYMPTGLSARDHDPVSVLIACGEKCLMRLHDVRTGATPPSLPAPAPKGKR
jgi:hypothetical protein